MRRHFAPGEAAQVDFGAGPMLRDPDGVERRTWAFVMTLCFSRHQYVEFVWDQSVATWLGCHRRAFEWFGAVPRRLIIDNAKCAITRACASDPLVQRAYGECALGCGFKIDEDPESPLNLVAQLVQHEVASLGLRSELLNAAFLSSLNKVDMPHTLTSLDAESFILSAIEGIHAPWNAKSFQFLL